MKLRKILKSNENTSSILVAGGEKISEVGVNLKQGYNGDLTSQQAGSIGGQMVKKMIYSYQQGKANTVK